MRAEIRAPPSEPTVPLRPPARTLIALVLAVTVSAAVSACGDDELTPEEQRRERVEERLELSFTDEQADCMMERFDEELFVALDREGQLPQGDALDEFSAIARECVVGESTTSTTSASTTSASTDTTAATTADTSG